VKHIAAGVLSWQKAESARPNFLEPIARATFLNGRITLTGATLYMRVQDRLSTMQRDEPIPGNEVVG
jgi:hypothetical protein